MAALCVILTAACCFDYREKKIPNLLCMAAGLYGIAWRALRDGPPGICAYLLQAVSVFALLYFFFRVGAVGAGDVKLLCLTAGYLPFQKVSVFLLVFLLFSAMISLAKLLRKGYFRERVRYFMQYLKKVWKSGGWKPYIQGGTDRADVGVCLSGPVLISLLLYLGGVY